MNVAIEQLLPWGPAKDVNTANGPRKLRKATPEVDNVFWKLWRENKDRLKSVGLSVSKNPQTLAWEVCWWIAPTADEIKVEQQAIEASRAAELTSDVEIAAPAGLEYLPYQKAGIVFASSKPGVLIADEMGLGKTIQAVGVINNDAKIQRVLVVCPASLKLNWARELHKWLIRKMTIGVADSSCFPSTDVVIINYDIIHKFPRSTGFYWDLLIVDEAHYLKNGKSRRAKHILGYNGKGEDANIPGIPARRKVFMTGTPICNRPVELWPLINALDPVTWKNFFAYAQRYCGATRIQAGRKMVWDFSGATNLEELQKRLRSTIMVRRLKKDVLKDMPPKVRQVIELPADGCEHLIKAELSMWDEREGSLDDCRAEIELAKAREDQPAYDNAVKKLRAGLEVAFTEVSRVRHETAMAKTTACIEHIQSVIEERGDVKFLIFAHHLDVIAQLRNAFPNSVAVTGDTPLQQRQANVDRFQNDPMCGPFIGNIKAAGVGLTLTAADLVIFVELDWVPGNVTQAEDRAHRYGQTKTVFIQHLVLNGSLDSRMAKTIVKKQEIMDRAMDAVIAAEPVHSRGNSVTLSTKELAETAANITPDQIAAIHEGLRMLAGVCNGARSWDGMGFSKIDANIGKSLAMAFRLSPKQAALGQRLVTKYRRQLGEDIVARAGGKIDRVEN